ncbi:MAG TPA: hypothetical protein VNG12_11145 [Acidimicrobiales bacterium]|nr:hypothetical protein [Acidimicrobiales bacterium]
MRAISSNQEVVDPAATRTWCPVFAVIGASMAGTLGRLGAKLLRIQGIVRFPIYLYRARLGFVFGSRLLLLEHVGRHTGARRYVVLEVVDHPSPSRYLVARGSARTASGSRTCKLIRMSTSR